MIHHGKRTGPTPYEVGYGKPPAKHQFQKGQSGNPRGRSKKRKHSVEGQFFAALNERVTVTENGKRKKITKLQAALKQASNKAAAGEMRALKLLVELVKRFDDPTIVRPITLVFEAGDEKL